MVERHTRLELLFFSCQRIQHNTMRISLMRLFANTAAIVFVLVCVKAIEGQQDGDVRLVNGLNPAEGRVEVYYNGDWGTVCDDGWDMSEANVVCRQLGFSSANTTHCCAHFGHGDGQIMLDDLGCRGDEVNLGSCNHRGWVTHNCAHTEDASVVCNGKIRLVGGSHSFEGRVEVYRENDWGTICNVGWDMKDANVVCKLMGYPSANSTTSPQVFGAGTGSIVVKDVACAGTEMDLEDCPKTFNSTCEGADSDPAIGPAGVRCTRPIRIIGGSSEMEGHVEIFDNGVYGSICDEGWDMDDARVVCKQLGNLAPVQAVTGSRYGESTSNPKISGVNCGGNEENLEQCGHGGWDVIPSTCTSSTLAGVVCAPAVRLQSGENQLEGRAEVYMNNRWGSICADNWDVKDARVFCNQLGGYPVQEDNCCYQYVRASLEVFIGDVQCMGNETFITDCVHTTSSSCSNNQVVGVRCMATVRLVGVEGNDLMGNVEVLHDGSWGAVCDDSWEINDARVVCRQLGNYEAVSSSCCGFYGQAQNPLILDDVGCTGSETKIEDCYHNSWGSHNCGPSEAAGVSCRKIRLVSDDSTTLPKGRVEIVHNGMWGRICSDGWGKEESDVLCRQLYNSTSEPHSGDFGVGTGPVYLRNIQCVGTETDILDCPHSGWGDYHCNGPDAFVVCRGGLRLADGRTPLEGRVEIFQDGQWGTVCDDNWDINDAKVVCRQLGNYEVLAAKCCAAYGHGSGPILLDGVGCTGNEEILEDCPHEGWGSHNCQHYEDASVACTDLRLTYENGTVATNKLQGRVEVWKNEQWKAICFDNFMPNDAEVVCRQLFNTNALRSEKKRPSSEVSIGISQLGCIGNETLLVDCPTLTFSEEDQCSSGYAAAVICKDIRLTGGKDASEGAVEILENGDWGLICGNTWNEPEGKVACRQLGFCGPRDVKRGWDSPPLSSRRDMHWYDMNCTGSEARLRDCQHSQGSYPCNGYSFEAAVICKSGCDRPQDLRHGKFLPDKMSYEKGEKIKFSCEKDYELIGNETDTCGSECKWMLPFPECQRSFLPDDKKDGSNGDKSGAKTGKNTAKGGGGGGGGGSGGIMFVVGLMLGAFIIVIVIVIVWLVRVRRRNTTGANIFKPKAEDGMEEPVLSFNSAQAGEDGAL